MQLQALTVFGFGLHGAVLRALVSNEDRAEEVRAALQLHTHFTTEIGDLICEADDPNGGAICFPFISAVKQKDRGIVSFNGYTFIYETKR